MKQMKRENILTSPTFENAKAASNDLSRHRDAFQRLFSGVMRIDLRPGFRNILRQSVVYLLILLFTLQPSAAVVAADRGLANSQPAAGAPATEADPGYFQQAYNWLLGENTAPAIETPEPPPPPPPTISEAAISRHHPSLNGGTIDGSLRVFSGESYAINSQFHLNGDLYAVGTPTITVNSGASHGGVINDGGSATPSGYGITLNSGVVLPGKIHTRANAIALPSDIPTSVPNPSGTRTVNINSPADLNSIGNWATLRNLNVNPSNLVINVPPGNYDTFSLNGPNIRLVFTAGTYNFSGTVNLNSGSNIQSNGAVTINVGQNLNLNNGSFGLGTGTSSSDVKLNVVGSSLSVNNNAQVWALVRAANATVNLNSAIIRGHLIANYLNINSGQIIGDANPADTTAPTLAITSPANNSTTTSTTINVTGTASDGGSGIASVTVNNVAAAYNAGAGTWSFANLNLALGSNVITVKATDGAGNVTTQTVTVTRQLPPDVTAPAVTITSPATNTTVPTATITVSGTASDTGLGATGINRVMVNGVQASYNSAAGTWTISGVPLNEGANTITAIAYDNAPTPNSNQASITVTRTTPDTQAPTVAITSPADNTTVPDATVTVSGTVADTGLNASGVNRVMVNGVQSAYNSGTGQWTISGVPLNEGANMITAIAYDNAPTPNSNQASITVTRTTPDTQAPSVAITSPANNTVVPDATVTVSGTVADTGLNASGVNRVMVNGVQAAYNSAAGTWTISGVPLNEGANTITAIAYDNAPTPNSSQTSITVTRTTPDTQAPTVSITSPADNTTLPDATVTVSGTVADTGLNASGVNRVMVTGVQASYDSGTGAWTISGVALNEGANTITAIAYDNAPTPNSSQTSITVTRTTPDTQAPTVSVTSPADGSETDGSTATITGIANDEGLNAAGVASVTVNGQTASYDATTHQWTISGIALAIGDNTITVTVVDGAANQVQTVIHITRKEIPPPTISIASPADNSTTTAENIPVSGSAAAFSTGDNHITQVTVNGNLASFDEGTGTWTFANFSLTLGSNVITAKATDSGGRETAAQITVVRNPVNQGPVAVDDVYRINEAGPEFNIKLPFKFSAASYLSGSPFNSIIGMVAAEYGKLYVSDSSGAIIAVDLATRATTTVTTLPYARPRNMVIGDASFGGSLIVSDHNSQPFSDCCTGQVLKIDPVTGQVTVLSDGNPSYPGFADPFGLAFSTGGNFPAGAYVMDFEGSSPYPPNLFRITGDGTRSPFLTNPSIWTTERFPTYLAFAPGGDFGNDLFVADSLGVVSPVIWRVDAQGGITSFVSGEPLRSPGIMKFGRGGIFGTDLYVLDNQLKSIFRITPGGTISVFARDLPLTEGLTSMEFAPDGQSLFVGAGSKLIRITSPASLSVTAPGVLANDTDNENDPLTAAADTNPSHGTLTFNSNGSFVYTAGDSFTGIDSFTYHASDAGLASNTATVTISNTVNQAPAINAGADQSLRLPAPAVLSGTVTDDGLPAGQTLAASWSKISGPGAVTFGNAGEAATTAAFSAVGTYVLRLTATDGELSIADDITIKVLPPNQAPAVNAGPDQTVTLPAAVNLHGTASDDGQPSSLSVTWSKVSGLGDVVFAAPGSPDTTACFAGSGVYVLRLTATDGESTVSDDVTVTIRTLNTREIKTGNGEIGQTEPNLQFSRDGGVTWQPAFIIEKYDSSVYFPGTNNRWGQIPGTKWVNFVNSHWTAGVGNTFGGTYTAKYRTTFNLPADYSEPSIKGSIEVDNEATVYLNGVQIAFHNIFVDPPASFFNNNPALFHAGENVIEVDYVDLGGGIGGLDYQMLVSSVDSGSQSNQAPIVSAGEDQIIYPPSVTTLNGVVRDDYLPSCGSSLSISWTKVSGPGSAVFANPNSAATTVSFSALGTYVLRLTGSDGVSTVSDDVTIVASAVNQPPQVSAGPDREVRLPDSINLSGTATDDGIPPPAQLSLTWSKVSGPGSVTFTTPNSLQTTASFGESGTYVLRLTASDSALSSSDETTVTVYPETAACPSDDFIDDFNDDQFDTQKWSIANPASPMVVSEQNQKLRITLAPNTAEYNSVSSNQAFDLTNKSFSVEVADPGSQAGWVSTFVFLELDGNNSYRMSAGAGSSVFEVVSGGASTQRLVTSYNYQPFWRMRHDAAANQIRFESSTNGQTWTLQHAVTPTIPLDSLRIRMGTGAYGTGNSSPGQAVFDNVRLVSVHPDCLPTVSITQPAENATFDLGIASIPIKAAAADSDGSISKVEFFADGIKIGEAAAGPYVFNWGGAAAGQHTLTAKATDDRGASAISAPVHITVLPPALCYQSDDFNDNTIDLAKWLAPPADGQVYERNQRLEITPFSAPYRDSNGSIKYNGYLTAASCDYSGVATSVEIVQATPFEYGVETDFRWIIGLPNYTSINVIGMVFSGPNLGFYYYVDGVRSITTITPDPVVQRFWRIRHILSSDEIIWETSPDNISWTIQRRAPRPFPITSIRAMMSSGTYLNFGNPGTAIFDNFNLSQTEPTNLPPIVNAGEDQSVAAGITANLAGTVTDDGLPAGSSVSAAWSKTSGPGDVIFADASAPATTASFSQPGSYVLRLTATDSALTASDEVTVVILSANQPPVADFSVPSAGGPVGLIVNSFSSPGSVPSNLLDESTFTNWLTTSGQNTNQFVKFELIGGEQLIQGFRFQQGNYPASYMVKDFIVQVSTTTSDDASFSTVLTGTLQTNLQLQEVNIPADAVHAKFVKFIAVNNHGGEPQIILSTFQVIGAGKADSIVSLPGKLNAARRASPSLLKNGAAISRSSSYGSTPVDLINDGAWKTNSKVGEFVVIKLADDKSHLLRGIRMGGNYLDYINYWVQNFEVWVSDTVDEDTAFTKVLDGVKTTSQTEDFVFPGGAVPARYIKYVPKSSRGTATFIGTFAIEALVVEGGGIYSFSSDYENSRVERAFDNNPQTAWYCAPGGLTNQWVKVRLDGTVSQKVYGVKIGGNNSIFGAWGPRDYQIRISDTTADDSAFTVIHSGTLTASGAVQEIRFAEPVDAKYVQFYWLNGYSDSWLSVYELEVLPLPSDGAIFTNISSQATMTVPAARILDLDQGPNYGQWESVSGQNTDQSLTLRLYDGRQFDIRHIALRPGLVYPQNSMAPKDFEIQVSTTDEAQSSFTTVFSGTAQPVDLLQHFYFPTVSARYVRLFIRNNYGNAYIGLNTFFVFAENTSGTDARFFDRSADSDGSIISYQWDFGDGSTGSGRNPAHSYAQEGVYNVSLTVTDSGGATNTTVKPYHALPTLKADFAYTPVNPVESDWYPNTVYFVNKSSSRLSNAGGQGGFVTMGTEHSISNQSFPAILFPDNGNYPGTIRHGSDYVLNYQTTKNIAVQNLPPGVNITDGKTVYWGENWMNAIISLGDPGPADRATLSGVWNFGDGTSSTCSNCTAASAQGTHSYALPGEYTAVLTITDKDGGSGSDSASYNVIKRPTAVVFNQPARNGSQLTISGTLFDSYANLPLAGKPVQIVLNGFTTSLTTDGGGAFQTTFSLEPGSQIGQIISYFAEDSFYQGSSNVYSAPPVRDNPPTGTPSNGGTDFWLAFPANYTDGSTSEALLITSETDTSGTVTAACGVNQAFQVTARTVTQIPIHRSCQLQNSNLVENLGIHVTAQAPVVVYGLNERPFTSDAFLALPVNTLGRQYYALAYGNQSAFAPSSQFGVVATENNTIVTITPSVTTDTRQQGIPYQVNLNQGQTYLLKNTEVGDEKDLTGSSIAADKPVAVFGGHQAATLPAPTVCCADHLVEQMPPVNTWGKRFLLVPSATRTKGDFFRVVAAYDNTVIYLNGSRAATINKGQFFEKLVTASIEAISTEPVMVGQYSTSIGFDTATYGGDPFMAIVPPYSQFLNHYTISTPNRFNNYINLTVPTSIVGQVVLDSTPIAAGQFTAIGTSGFSSAQIPIAIGTHNLDAPAPFGVLSYGYSADEGYGYPGGMSLIPSVRSTNLTLDPETASFGINSPGCVTASLKDENNDPLGGRTVSFNVLGANPTNGSGVTNASGQSGFCYTGANAGSDTITASFDSITASSTFIWSAVNQPPTVNAGNDQGITLPAVANLSGSATDDGYPSNTLTYAWSKVSGAGDVTFGAPNALATTAAFSLAGTYVLRLTVSDGEFSVSDDVTVAVAAGNVNQPPAANAGPDQTATLNADLLRNPGAESELVGGEVPNWTEVQGSSWTRVSESAGGPPARFGRYTFNAGSQADAELRQDVDLRAFSLGINDGTLQFTWKAFIRSLPEAAPDGGTVIVEYRDALNQNTIASLNSGEITTTGVWQETEDTRVPPAGTGFMRIRLIAQRHTGATNDVFFDGLTLRAEGPVAAVLLDGTTTDDGLPAGSSLQSSWTRVSGPGAVSFADPSAADSPASFTVAGTYVLRLTTSDGVLSASDDVTVTVNPANTTPVVNAGADQTITLPNPAQLNGSVTDDGEPQGGVITSRWSKVSGPGAVTFGDASVQSTSASFSTAGTYVLRLFAEDGELEAIDEVTITVNAQNNPVNQPPTVEAGNNQTIQLPVNSAALNGTVTDDGLPNNSLTITWTKTSGPGNVSFANPNAAQTSATFDAAGSYVLRLTVSDGQYTSFDEVAVNVNPAGAQNQPPTVVISPDQTISLSQQAILEALTLTDDGLPAGGNYSYQWTKVSGPGTVTFTNPAETATYATFSEIGVYVVRLTASDSELTGSDDATVTVTEDQPAPAVEILTPDDGISITEPTAITGTVTAGNWRLEYSLTDTDNLNNRSWTTAASGTGAASGTLGTLDTTLMLNGLYDVRLITDNNGQLSSDIISVSVENNLKIGHFTISFDDMSVPVAGIPIQIIRTYDSRDKRKGDFGYGWTLGIKNLRLEKNAVLGLKWYQTRSVTFIPTYCVEPTRPHIVSVTTPDGKVQKFEAGLAVRCQQAANITGGNVVFTPQAGAQGKLEVIGSNEVAVAGSVPGPVELIGFDGNGIFDRTSYKYTAKDGTEFIMDQLGGLQSVKDTNNNTLTISSSGITHSSGTSIAFTRDAAGRITHVTDPAGKSNVYTYDTAGDLVSFKDRENNTTSFTYEPTIPHHLKSIVDPLGRTGIRNEYDASGRLIKHVDGNGEEIVYTHDLTARAEIIRDRLGNETRFEYDARGNVLKKRDALNHETTFTYDANDNVLTETNALGKTNTYTYDPQDNRTSITDALGNRTEFTHNTQGRALTVKDARNKITTHTYDTAGNLLTTTDAAGNVTSSIYSIQTGKLALMRNALNEVTTFEYVGDYLTKQTDDQGNETTFGYDANGNRISQTAKRTNALGQIETVTNSREFDNLNRLVKTTLADLSVTRIEYDNLGKQKASIDQAGNRTEYEYDVLGRLIKTTYPDSKFEETTYDAEGHQLTSKDRSGRITRYEYDALGRLKKTIYPNNAFTQTFYDAAGQVVSSTDAAGNITTYAYDGTGRRTQVKNALDQTTEFTYDPNGNQLTVKDALNHTTTSVYDDSNRREKTIYADGTFTQTTFDALGRKTAARDQAGKVTQYFFDSLGRLSKVKDALNQETRYEYNEIGQQIKQIDALNRETRYEYDKVGRRTKRILPLGQVETYSYGSNGNLASRTDFNGKTTSFAYDNMHRLLSKTPDASLNQPATSFTYNNIGQRATMTDASGTTNYAYDTLNRLASKQTPFGTLSYTYNETGNIETLRSSNTNGVSVDYDYDDLNRLDTVKDNRLAGNQDTTYTYDAIGNLQSYSCPNQVTTSYGYNNLNRLTTMTVSNTAGALASYSYTLGEAGNRTQVVENGGRTVNYVYDDLYRLTQETIAGAAVSGNVNYGYDAVGNRLNRASSVSPVPNQSSTFDANDRLESDTYDANGNTKISNGKTYNYDFGNKLTSTSDGVTIVYDGDGNRVSKTAGGVTTHYLVDTNNLTGYAQVVEEIQGGSVVKAYTYGHDLISQRVVGGGVSFYGYDGHGSVRNLTDSSAQITDTYTYDSFGNLIERTGTTSNDYLYAGEQFDASLGLYYNRARYLNTETGRFISFDTNEGNASDPRSLHKYLYTGNNPVDRIDPSGNSYMEQIIAFSVNVILRTMAFINSPAVRLGFAILNIYTFIRHPEAAHMFFATGGNPSELAAVLCADFRTLLGGARVLSTEIRQGVATINYNGGDVRDFWYKATELKNQAQSNGLSVVEGTTAIRDVSVQAKYRRAAITTYANNLRTQFGVDRTTARDIATRQFSNYDVDHLIDLQVSGGLANPNDASNLGMIESTVNRSIGSQLKNEINSLGLEEGDMITDIIINGPPDH
jgi:RHS repeat-associated protein